MPLFAALAVAVLGVDLGFGCLVGTMAVVSEVLTGELVLVVMTSVDLSWTV